MRRVLKVKAELEKWKDVRNFIEKTCAEEKISLETEFELKIVIEELFANVINYSCSEYLLIQIDTTKQPYELTLQVIDSGVEFNPLQVESPDFSVPYEDKEVGGLGIFLVKENVDKITYERRDGKNILTIVKKL